MLRSVAFCSSFVCRLPLDPYGGNDSDRMFPHFCKQVAWELAPKLAVIFIHRFRGGSLRRRLAKRIYPKESSSDIGDYRHISITSVLSKVFEKFVSRKLSNFLNGSSLFPTFQFLYRRDLGACDAFFTLSHHLQDALHSETTFSVGLLSCI